MDTKYTGGILGFLFLIREDLSNCFRSQRAKIDLGGVYHVLFDVIVGRDYGSDLRNPRVGLACKIASYLGCMRGIHRRRETGKGTRVFQELKSCVYWIERLGWITIGPEIWSSTDRELGISLEMGLFHCICS